ncbi:MAG: hypothetical protein AAGG50_07210 [Bacteroidota bacterium]
MTTRQNKPDKLSRFDKAKIDESKAIRKILSNVLEYVFPVLTVFSIFIGIFISRTNIENKSEWIMISIAASLGFIGITSLIDRKRILSRIEDNSRKIIYDNQNIVRTIDNAASERHNMYIINKSNMIENAWNEWRSKPSPSYRHISDYAISSLMDSYLKNEYNIISNRKVRTTSDIYTELISNVSKYLNRKYKSIDSESYLYRYQFTGMLPEEFFNGPQIEYTKLDSHPVIFCHQWEDENYKRSLYAAEQESKEYIIRRCIIVREKFLPSSKYSALSTIDDLKEQCKLYILEGDPLSMMDILSKEHSSSAERLLRHAKFRLIEYREQNKTDHFIKKIVNSGNYEFYPICKDPSGDGYENLIGYFSDFFQSDRERDALYFCIDNSNRKMIDKANSQRGYFQEGNMPEITLFGKSSPQYSSPPEEWEFAIKCQYKPFSRDIEIEILNKYQANEVSKDFKSVIYQDSEIHTHNSQSLISLLDESQSIKLPFS